MRYLRMTESETANVIDNFRYGKDKETQIQFNSEKDILYEYQKYHRYIREHRLKGVKVRKRGENLWLTRA